MKKGKAQMGLHGMLSCQAVPRNPVRRIEVDSYSRSASHDETRH